MPILAMTLFVWFLYSVSPGCYDCKIMMQL